MKDRQYKPAISDEIRHGVRVRDTIRNARRSLLLAAQRSGILIMKAPSVKYEPIPVFRLAAERLMQLRGDRLRFIQVGANDGVYGDPIRSYIYNKAWTGILVEPQIDVFNRLKANYENVGSALIFENLAIGAGSDLILYRPPASVEEGGQIPHGLTVVSSDPKVVSRQAGISVQALEKVRVASITLDELIERHGYEGFDVLQIDVEGFDLDVLQTLSLDRHRPGVIQFEHGHLNRAQLTRAAELLSRHGYRFYYGGREFNDSVAMPQELVT